MNVPTRVAAFGLLLTGVFGAAAAVGDAAGPVVANDAASKGHGSDGSQHGGQGADSSGDRVSDVPGGLSATRDGYTLRLHTDRFQAGVDAELRFTVERGDGRPETSFTPTHDRKLHLIVVSRDLTDFQHLHPQLQDDGTWSMGLLLRGAGAYKVFADFTAAGRPAPTTLAADVLVSGDFDPDPLPSASRTAVVDGYTVTLDGTLTPGAESRLTLTVRKDGREVTDLQPYLGAYGHLVSLRTADLAYLHVHPAAGGTSSGPDVPFSVRVPAARGSYRLFFDFQHEGVVRTAAFTHVTRAGAAATASPVPVPTASASHDTTDHSH